MDKDNLMKDLEEKVAKHFSEQKSYIDYLLQTQKNFLYRYLETSNQKEFEIKTLEGKIFYAESFEVNMGEALKIKNLEVKNGVKYLAKSFSKEEKPALLLHLSSEVKNLSSDRGEILLKALISWDFPRYELNKKENLVQKTNLFEFSDPHQFRKNLALKFEEVCTIFE